MVATICLITSTSVIDELLIHAKNNADLKIFSMNYFVHQELTKKGISHIIGDEYLSETDKNFVYDLAIDKSTSWGTHKNLAEFLSFQGINLASLIEVEIYQYLTSVYRDVLSMIKIIEIEKPNQIIASTYLDNFLEIISKQNNITLKLVQNKEKPSLFYDKINIKLNLYYIPISITLSRKNYLRVKALVEKTINLLYDFEPNSHTRNQKSILLLDFNPVYYDVLLKELSKLNKNILLLNQRRPAIWNLKSLRILKNSKCKIINLSQFRNDVIQLDTELQNLTKNLTKMWKLDSIFENMFLVNSYSFWPSIKDSFSKICNSRFIESARRILLLNELFSQYDISVILEWAEAGQEEKETLFVGKQKGIKSVMLQHAMYPTGKIWDKFGRFLSFFSYPLLSDSQAIWGEIFKNYALKYGYDEKKLLVTGSPRHDNFFNHKKKEESKGIIILATTGATEVFSENSPTLDYTKFNDFVKEVCRVVKNLPNKQLIVKPHPQPDFVNNIIELIREIDPNIKIVLDTNLVELINSCDLLITFKNSTIALESLILNKPTISLQTEKWPEESEIVKMNALLSISDINEIENGIKKMLFDNEFREKFLMNGKKFVEQYFANPGFASKTLAKILDEF